ncbi:MAG: transcription antitermination factor NusB, partial [Candidatus Aerophobetes bacterium]|nr:transcription antitermination factor NusB [Candidatus Aerophobetes bacterium]
MKDRRKARELALQVLYQIDIRKTSAEEVLETVFSRYRFKLGIKKFSERLIYGTTQFILPIDSSIEKYAKNWTLERMTIVDRNVLRLAIYELLFLKDIPSAVSINEAIDIAKRYGIE